MTEQFIITNEHIFRAKHTDYMYTLILIIFNYTQDSYFIDLVENLQFVEMLVVEVFVIHLNTTRILDNCLHHILLLEPLNTAVGFVICTWF